MNKMTHCDLSALGTKNFKILHIATLKYKDSFKGNRHKNLS